MKDCVLRKWSALCAHRPIFRRRGIVVMRRVMVILICVLIVVTIASGQSPKQDGTMAQKTLVGEYWIDPATGLMWAGKDNGKDVNLSLAMKYCTNLRLSGFSDWRLAKIDELQGIYDENLNTPGKTGYGRLRRYTWHVKGNIFLTGVQWSSTFRVGHNYVWGFDFYNGIRWEEDVTFWTGRRALCVRAGGQAAQP